MDLFSLSQTAITAARSAGQVILQHLNTEVVVEMKADASSYAAQVVTAVDRACEEALLSYLLPTCEAYDLALLSEESPDDGSRLQKNFFWCIDPMDGTLAFIERRAGFSVSIALVALDGTPQLGVVLDPTTDTLYHAVKDLGVYKNGQVWQPQPSNNLLTYVSDRPLQDTPRAAEIEAFLQEQATRLDLPGVK
ncbi:MAG: inositol monophosphatase, partial [Bacteroidetes bacterium]